ncbi:gp53-like domain-containing protein [Lysobacter antibioticus]|nr:hypothetical protein [Lysobacter antibioticus]
MAAFRVLDPFQTFFNLDSTAPAAGGRVDFFESGTSTPKAVYADPGLTTSNGSSIDLDAAGRLEVDCWGDGAYRVRQYDADDTLVKELDNIQPTTSSGLEIPTPLEAGAVLSNDGAILQWLQALFMPDPTGQNGKFPQANGSGYTLVDITIPTPAAPDIVLTGTGAAGSFRAGTTAVAKKFYLQWGSDTMAASGQTAAAGSFNFPAGFDEAPRVLIVGKSASVAAEGQIPAVAVTNTTTTGFSVAMNTDDYTRNGSRINSAVPFDWFAIGFKTV